MDAAARDSGVVLMAGGSAVDEAARRRGRCVAHRLHAAIAPEEMFMQSLHLRQNGKVFRFLKVEFRDRADGSLYIIFDRAPNGSETFIWDGRNGAVIVPGPARTGRFRISYHATGTIVFHEHPAQIIYDDPIYELSGARDLAQISLPSVDRLDTEENISPSDAVIDLPNDLSGRVTFKLSLVAPEFQFSESPLSLVAYEGWFAVALYLTSDTKGIPPETSDLSPFIHPVGSRARTSFEPWWLGDATGRGAEPHKRSDPSRCFAGSLSLA